MWAATRLDILETHANEPPILLSAFQPNYNPFDFCKECSGIQKAGMSTAFLKGVEVVALQAGQTEVYTSCGNPACEGKTWFEDTIKACPFCAGYAFFSAQTHAQFPSTLQADTFFPVG